MMWRVYYSVMKLIGPLALTVFYMLNSLTRAKRARALLLAPDGQVLLVVNVLGDRRWTLPGGGIQRGETSAQAASREVAEELLLDIPMERYDLLGVLPAGSYEAPVLCVQLRPEEIASVGRNKFEIYAYRWYKPGELPIPIQPLVHDALGLLSARAELATIK